VYVSPRRDGGAARCFFTRALATTKVIPVQVITDKAAVYPNVVHELAPRSGTYRFRSGKWEARHCPVFASG